MIAAACRSWQKPLFRVLERKPTCRRSRSWTLCLEPLEDRTLLSTFFVVNAGDTGSGCATSGDPRYCITQANTTPGARLSVGSHTIYAAHMPCPNGFDSSTGTVTQNGETAPSITRLSSNSAVEGSGAFTLTVNGSGFNQNSTVQWNNSALATTYDSRAGQVKASVPAGDVAQEGTASVKVVNCDGGSRTSNTVTFTITDAVPTVSADKASVTAPETQAATNTGTWSDYDDSVTLSADHGTVTQNANGTWSWSGTDDESSPYTVTITATDADGGKSTTSFNVSFSEVAPNVAVTTAPTSVAENAIASASGSFSDHDHNVTLSASEGSISQTGSTNGTWSWSETAPLIDGSHTVTITATNSDGLTSSTSFTFTVTDVAPSVVVATAPPTSVDENTNVSASGTFADYDDRVTITASEGSISQTGSTNGTWSWSETAPLSDGSHTVTITATNSDGITSSTSFTFTVTLAAPSVAVTTAPTSVAENAIASASGSFSDPDHNVMLSASEGSISQTGSTNGTWSWSETAPLSDGSHTVTITATNSDGATSSTSFTFTVTHAAPSITFVGNSGLVEVSAGQPMSLTGSFTIPDGDQVTGTVNYGDGSGVQPLLLAPNHTFTLNHIYQQEGSYLLTVEITDDGGVSGFASIPIEVYNAGVDLTQIKQATADSPTISEPGITATLFTASATGSLLLAPVTQNEVEQLGGGAFQAEFGAFVSAFDFRSVNLTAQDKLIATFQLSRGEGTPALEYFDTASQSFKPVLGSTLLPNSLVIDSVDGTITLILDESSTPRLTDLSGTVFVVSIPQAQLSPLAVSPPLASTSSVAAEATTGTAFFSAVSVSVLPSGTSISIPPTNIQTASNNSSVNELSAFSLFVLGITASRLGTYGSEANAGAEANLSLASPPDVLSLLNRLPRAPASEDRFTPPDSGPRGVLSPSRAGFPEGTDGAEAPGQAPAPVPPPPAKNLPPVGLRDRPIGHETANGHEMMPDEDVFRDKGWLDEALSELFRSLTWHENGTEGEHAPVHPAVAVLVLGAGFVPRAARRMMPPSRSQARSGID
ncbi:MAG TPA: Ig-like domain-containing protein [Gemmataceae bacterium]|nr:Ig-like domain-containing protein [Gemmataceae bacterium]